GRTARVGSRPIVLRLLRVRLFWRSTLRGLGPVQGDATVPRLAAATPENKSGPASDSGRSGPTWKVVERSATFPAASTARRRTEWDPPGRSSVSEVVVLNHAQGPLSTLTSNRATPEPPSHSLPAV